MALPRANRLSLRFERERLTKTGKTLHGQFFAVVVATPPAPNEAKSEVGRFAILLSKKTAPLAVDRNKIKRITSAIVESLLSSIPLKEYLIIPKRQVLSEDYKNLLKDLSTILKST